MRPLLRLVATMLIFLSLGLGTVAHAGEIVPETHIDLCVEDANHAQGESRDSDTGKLLHAHGGCHGHHQVDALAHRGQSGILPVRALNFAMGEDFLPQLVPDANLRPPIA